jgi:ankyrin repeat protein
MLLSGANPNSRTGYLHNAPLLCLATHQGYVDIVSMLLEFAADPNLCGDDDMSALCYAAAKGNVEIIKLLVSNKAKVITGGGCVSRSQMCLIKQLQKKGWCSCIIYNVML